MKGRRTILGLLFLLFAAAFARSIWWPRSDAPLLEVKPSGAAPVPATADSNAERTRFVLELHPDQALVQSQARVAFELSFRGEAEPRRVEAAILRARQELVVALPEDYSGEIRGRITSERCCLTNGGTEFRVPTSKEPFTLTLSEARKISLEVFAEDSGQALKDVEILHQSGLHLAATDESGRCALSLPSHRRVLLQILCEPYLPAGVLLEPGGDSSLRVPLLPRSEGGVVELRLARSDETPVGDAIVTARWTLDGPAPTSGANQFLFEHEAWNSKHVEDCLIGRFRSDESGLVRIPYALSGTLKASAMHPSLGQAGELVLREELLPAKGRTVKETLHFPDWKSLQASVRSGPAPVPGCVLELVRASDGKPEIVNVSRTDEEGKAPLTLQATERLHLVARAPKLAVRVIPVTESLLLQETLEIELEAGCTVKLAIPGIQALEQKDRTLEIVDVESGVPLQYASPDLNGAYRFLCVPRGVPLLLRRVVDRAAQVVLVSPLLLGAHASEEDLGVLSLSK